MDLMNQNMMNNQNKEPSIVAETALDLALDVAEGVVPEVTESGAETFIDLLESLGDIDVPIIPIIVGGLAIIIGVPVLIYKLCKKKR